MTQGGRTDCEDQAAGPAPAAFLSLSVLRKRADFLRAARATRLNLLAFGLQARARQAEEAATIPPDTIRIGFTCSRKVGNAVARNRARRRLRAIAREVVPQHGQAGWDYVLIGRPETTAQADFDAMRAELARALARVHAARPDASRPSRPASDTRAADRVRA
ncbi:MAG: ribonuclease P protein component [Rubellimicrobium sp.]|nr:ribonuclease P protein component [Rubellimicrobium sp.]